MFRRLLTALTLVGAVASCSSGPHVATSSATTAEPTTLTTDTAETLPATTVPAPTSTVPPTSSTTLRVTSTTTAKPAPIGTGPCVGAAPTGRADHVVVVFMENHLNTQVLASAAAPFERQLAAGCATAERYASVGSPSLPNYLGATSGQTHGVADDGSPAQHPITADNVFRQVRSAGGRARTYAEAMPSPCWLQPAGRYAVKHNPAAYFQGGDDRAACQRDDLPLGTPEAGPLADDLAAGTLAELTVVVPDLCNDTHDCPVATGDAWLHRWVDALTASRTYRQGRTVLFVVWDEPTPMPFIAVTPAIRPGTVVHGNVDHYSLLRCIDELLGLPTLTTAPGNTDMRSALGI